MAHINCIVIDNGSFLSLDSKMIIASDGEIITDLYPMDINKFTETELIELIEKFSSAYELGQNMAKKKMQKIFQNFTDSLSTLTIKDMRSPD